MKESLKSKLNKWIESEGGKFIPIDVIEHQVKLWGYKMSNAERRLRDSESPNVGKATKNGAIIYYFWRGTEEKPVTQLAKPTTKVATEFLQKWGKKEEVKPINKQMSLL